MVGREHLRPSSRVRTPRPQRIPLLAVAKPTGTHGRRRNRQESPRPCPRSSREDLPQETPVPLREPLPVSPELCLPSLSSAWPRPPPQNVLILLAPLGSTGRGLPLPPSVYSFITIQSGFETSYLLSRQTPFGVEGTDGKTATPPSNCHRSGFDLGPGPARARCVVRGREGRAASFVVRQRVGQQEK